MTAIWDCALQNWQIGIGDPGVMGWVIVVLYVLTGIMALWTAMAAGFPSATVLRERFFWLILGLILLALGLNKQLDLQSFLTASARCMAEIQGWYETRRVVQVGFIIWVLVMMLVLAIVLLTALRGTFRRNGLALVGLIVVLGFVAIRAAGFHHFDRLIKTEIESVRLNWVLEMAGPMMILGCAIIILRRRRR